jgi:hypothetical protein
VPSVIEPSLKLTYAITPPNQTTRPERRQALAAAQSACLADLPIDELLVYDLQDEAARNGAQRPFPFVPKVDALSYAFEDLHIGNLPRVVYRTVAEQDAGTLRLWLDRLRALGGRAVLVGAPSHSFRPSLTLTQAFGVCRSHAPSLAFGGVMIAERHRTTGTEDARVWAKMQHGCGFFVSQTVWSVEATKHLLRDLQTRSVLTGTPLPQLLLTLSPCGSEQTLLFQEWLGVTVPPKLRRELLLAQDMLARSVELAVDIFAEVQAFARGQGIVVGCNVESVSSRAVEVEASIELVRRIKRLDADRSQAAAVAS